MTLTEKKEFSLLEQYSGIFDKKHLFEQQNILY